MLFRYSDFGVNEIDLSGNVVRLTSRDVRVEGHEEEAEAKKEAPEGGDYPRHSDLAEADRRLFSSLQWIRMTELAKKYLGDSKPSSDHSDVVTVDVTAKDKEERKRIHDLVRNCDDARCSEEKSCGLQSPSAFVFKEISLKM